MPACQARVAGPQCMLSALLPPPPHGKHCGLTPRSPLAPNLAEGAARRRALLATGCKTYAADIAVAMKLANGTQIVISVSGDQAKLYGSDNPTGTSIGAVTPFCVSAARCMAGACESSMSARMLTHSCGPLFEQAPRSAPHAASLFKSSFQVIALPPPPSDWCHPAP